MKIELESTWMKRKLEVLNKSSNAVTVTSSTTIPHSSETEVTELLYGSWFICVASYTEGNIH